MAAILAKPNSAWWLCRPAMPMKFWAATRAPNSSDIDQHMRLAKCRQLMDQGVTILFPETCVIDSDVEVGADTVIEPCVQLRGTTRVGSDTRIHSYSVIMSCEIGDNVLIQTGCVLEHSVIRARASLGPYSHLRPGCEVCEDAHVGNFVELKKTRIGKGSKANHLTYLGDTEVGERVNVGAGTITCNYDGVNKHKTSYRRWRVRRQRQHPDRAGSHWERRLRGRRHHRHRRCPARFPGPGPRPPDRERRLGQSEKRKSAGPKGQVTPSRATTSVLLATRILALNISPLSMTFHFDDITVMFLLWVLVLHPAAAWRGYRRLARGEPIGSKVYRFRLSLYVILCSTLIALAVAVTRQLALPWAASASSFTFGLIFSTALVVSVTLQRKKVDPAQQERIRLLYAPTGTTEWILGLWVGLCAGVGEEIVYRAVLVSGHRTDHIECGSGPAGLCAGLRSGAFATGRARHLRHSVARNLLPHPVFRKRWAPGAGCRSRHLRRRNLHRLLSSRNPESQERHVAVRLWNKRHHNEIEIQSRQFSGCRSTYFDTAANNGECSKPWNCLSSALKCICRFELSELTVTLSSASFSTGVADIFL